MDVLWWWSAPESYRARSWAIEGAVQGWNPTRQVQVSFVPYDDLFARAPLGAAGWAEAIWKLLASGVSHGLGDLLHPGRGFLGLSNAARWTAGDP